VAAWCTGLPRSPLSTSRTRTTGARKVGKVDGLATGRDGGAVAGVRSLQVVEPGRPRVHVLDALQLHGAAGAGPSPGCHGGGPRQHVLGEAVQGLVFVGRDSSDGDAGEYGGASCTAAVDLLGGGLRAVV